MRNALKRIIANFTKYRHLLYELVKKDIKLKYRSSVLGLLWTLLEPLLTMLVLTIVFEKLMNRTNRNYDFPVYVLTGRLMYSYFSNGTKLAMKSIRRNAHMIRKVYVPKYIYPISSAMSSYVTFLFSLIVLAAVCIVRHIKPSVYLLQAVLPLMIVFIMALGIGLIISVLDVFFRDMEYMWNVIVMLIMYLSAIFYDAEQLLADTKFRFLLKLNPLYTLIANFRYAVFGEPMNMTYLLYSMVFGFFALAAGTFLFYRQQDKFVLYI